MNDQLITDLDPEDRFFRFQQNQLRILLLPMWTVWGSFLMRKSFRKICGLFAALIYYHVISSCGAMWNRPWSYIYWRTEGQNHKGHSLHWCSDAVKSIPKTAEVSSSVSGSERRAFWTSHVTVCSILTYCFLFFAIYVAFPFTSFFFVFFRHPVY